MFKGSLLSILSIVAGSEVEVYKGLTQIGVTVISRKKEFIETYTLSSVIPLISRINDSSNAVGTDSIQSSLCHIDSFDSLEKGKSDETVLIFHV